MALHACTSDLFFVLLADPIIQPCSKVSQIKCKPAILGYGVNKQYPLGSGEGWGTYLFYFIVYVIPKALGTLYPSIAKLIIFIFYTLLLNISKNLFIDLLIYRYISRYRYKDI